MRESEVTNWDWLILKMGNYLDQNNLVRDKSAEIINGYKKLRAILGDDFLKKPSNSIAPHLYNFAPWSLFKNSDFGLKLEMVSRLKNFKDICERLLMDNFENSFGAEGEIEIAGDFLKKGFEVDLLKQNKKNCDLKVKVGSRWIYFEITTFRTYSEEATKAQDFSFNIGNRINQISQTHNRFIEVDFNCMTRTEAESCVDNVLTKAVEVVKFQGEVEYIVSGVRLRISKREDGYGFPYIHSLKSIANEAHAIPNKLSYKLSRNQLPDDESGILLIFTKPLFLPDFQVLSGRLLHVIKTRPNCSVAVIQCISHERVDFSGANGCFEIIHRTEHDELYNVYNLIIPNTDCSHPLNYGEFKKLFQRKEG